LDNEAVLRHEQISACIFNMNMNIQMVV